MQSIKMSALAATAALLLTGVANAGEPATEIAVRYDDLDLGTEKGAATMVERVDQAARNVCGAKALRDPGRRVVRTYVIARFGACHDQAMQSALARIESREVRRAYAAYREGRETRG